MSREKGLMSDVSMNASIDLRRLLQSWPYDPDNDARLAQGEDGRPLLQVRTPLGLEQYELEGRPDGARPHGMDSALDYYLQRLDRSRTAGKESEFELGPRECGELFNEGTLYYFRYVRLFQLKDWPRTLRDTSRNLRLFDFVKQRARRLEDQLYLEKVAPLHHPRPLHRRHHARPGKRQLRRGYPAH